MNFEPASTSVSQFEHIDLLGFAYDAEQPLGTDFMKSRHQPDIDSQETLRLTQARQDLRDERALPPGYPQHRENGVIDGDLNQITNHLSAQQVLQDATAGLRSTSSR